MGTLDKIFVLGALVTTTAVQVYTFTSNGNIVLIKPPAIITAVQNHDIPSYDYYPPLDSHIDSVFTAVS
jgi:hypothetical protein